MNKLRQTKLMDTDNSMVVPEGKGHGGEVEKDTGGQIHSDGRRLDFVW